MDVRVFRELERIIGDFKAEQLEEATLRAMETELESGKFDLRAHFAHSSLVIKDGVPLQLVRDSIAAGLAKTRKKQVQLLNLLGILAKEEIEECLENKSSCSPKDTPTSNDSSETESPSDGTNEQNSTPQVSTETDVFTDIANDPFYGF